MSSKTPAPAPAPNPTTAASDPATTSSSSTTTPGAATKTGSKDAPGYTADISPPAYTDNTADAPAPAYNEGPTYTLPDTNDDADATTTTTTTNNTTEDLPTLPIPFNFLLRTSPPPAPPQKLTHTHPIPAILCGAAPPPADAEELFIDVLSSALGAHQAECVTAAAEAGQGCDICEAEVGEAVLSPVSFLHLAEGEQRVDVLVTPVCGKDECGQLARRRVRCAMEDEHAHEEERVRVERPQGVGEGCRVCGEGAGETMACKGCGVVRYCGRECQRVDWKREHKRLCQTYRELVEDGRMMEGEGEAEGRVEG